MEPEEFSGDGSTKSDMSSVRLVKTGSMEHLKRGMRSNKSTLINVPHEAPAELC